jgi:glycosyltransferase involved in cell wall biosynthesis
MRIAFDVSPLSHARTGVNNYIRGSLAGLAEVARPHGHEIVAFAPTSPAGRTAIRGALDGLDVELALVPLPAAHAIRTAWSAAGRPPAERFLGPFDVLHFSDWMYPPQARGVRATTIHDLVPVHHPEWTTPRTRAMHGRKYRNAARTCDVIMANSAFTADDVASTLGFPRERIVVAPPGIGGHFGVEGERADLGAPYVLTVATLEPRKNLGTLVEAFASLEETGLLLAVVGGAGWGEQPQLDRRGIVRLGRVTDEELARLYRGARCLVYPSLYEGFGIPVAEALACGTPVVTSRDSAMAEIADGRAELVDPLDVDDIARGIRTAMRPATFVPPSWDETARQTLAVYEEAAA